MSPETIRRIHALAGEGLSARAIARLVDSTHPTVAKVLASAPPPVPAHAQPAPPGASTLALDAPAIDTVRELLMFARDQVNAANSQNNVELAQRHTRNAAALASVLARLEKVDAETNGPDVVRIDRASIVGMRAELVGRIAAMRERPPLCSECSRELSVKWGTEK